MATALSIANEALIRIGAEPLASFAEQTAQAAAMNAIYNQVTRRLLADHFWSFALREKMLTELVLTASQRRLVDGEHVFQLPADALRVIGLRSFDQYQLAGDQLYTDATEAQCLYVADVPESAWPYWFVDLCVLDLAAAMAISVTDSSSRADIFYREAARARVRARSIDSQQTPPAVFDLMRILTAHRNNPLASDG